MYQNGSFLSVILFKYKVFIINPWFHAWFQFVIFSYFPSISSRPSFHNLSFPSFPPLYLLSPLQKMSQEFEIKRLSLEEQRDRLQQQLDNLKEELSAKLNMANQEVKNI